MRVLLLGGSGFIGGRLAARLRERGWDTATVARSQQADIRLDALDLEALRALVRADRSDAVVNLLGTGLATASVDARTLATINAEVPATVLAAALDRPSPPAFVHAASSTERTDDVQPDESEYSRTKHEGALALRDLAVQATSPVGLLRIHNTYGPGQPRTRFVAHTMEALRVGEPVTLNFPHRVRDFVFVDDVVESFVVTLDRGRPGLAEEDIGTGAGTSLIDMARRMATALGQQTDLVRGVEPPLDDPHPWAVASTPGGTLGTCVTSLTEGLERMTGGR